MKIRHRVTPIKVVSVRINMTEQLRDRILYLMPLVRAIDPEEVIQRAIKFYDRGVCAAVIDGSRIIAEHRDGSLEDFRPEEPAKG